MQYSQDKCVPITTPWHVLRLRMEEQPPIWRVAANILIKQLMATNKGWYTSLGLCVVRTTPHCKKVSCYEIQTGASDLD